ncbi:3-hydroxyacyl-CoA dehydrogenase NAD-binding domain-containing protein [Brevundimonas sp.]|uniref:3-hydroxyacyl-CoA dehydrogenase NAD-binding domain-containing protein n=1 Tax=Brevundimonas sp. TaxID=1871086 RepID=UPI001A2A239C|nr:3-hydroxyacyl-CoA dehydrogenase NAD-binding domain-containing protein [Brevundimonas sp.]MBJ7483685.1 hypothetical protein [Brevundimonas sp.]
MEMSRDAVVVVVGAGAMGGGIAQVAALAGHVVRVIDPSAAALDRARNTISASLAALTKRGTHSTSETNAALARLTFTKETSSASGATLVIEAIVEQLAAKLQLFEVMSRVVGPDAILASNTSSLSIADLANATPGPHRVLGLHFFNPAPIMRLVEIVPGPVTPVATIDAMIALMRTWAKHPVVVRDVPGFIVNRVARPYYAEGFAALGEGIAPERIDAALTSSGGFRLGPLALADLIGHDVNYAVACSIFDAYGGQTRFRPQSTQRTLFEEGRLGRKTGSGVYDYAAAMPSATVEVDGPEPRKIQVSSCPGRFLGLATVAREAGLPLTVDHDLGDERLRVGNEVIAFGDGRRLRDRPGVSGLMDTPRDPSDWMTWVASAASPSARAVIAGLAGALGRTVLFVPDRPGQIVLRTLAQLANSAGDAVQDGVASEEGIDDAMVHGANHPQGPLAWARRHGLDRVARTLNNIADATGEDFYRPSPWFREARLTPRRAGGVR